MSFIDSEATAVTGSAIQSDPAIQTPTSGVSVDVRFIVSRRYKLGKIAWLGEPMICRLNQGSDLMSS